MLAGRRPVEGLAAGSARQRKAWCLALARAPGSLDTRGFDFFCCERDDGERT
jgi:hypothetical protein